MIRQFVAPLACHVGVQTDCEGVFDNNSREGRDVVQGDHDRVHDARSGLPDRWGPERDQVRDRAEGTSSGLPEPEGLAGDTGPDAHGEAERAWNTERAVREQGQGRGSWGRTFVGSSVTFEDSQLPG